MKNVSGLFFIQILLLLWRETNDAARHIHNGQLTGAYAGTQKLRLAYVLSFVKTVHLETAEVYYVAFSTELPEFHPQEY